MILILVSANLAKTTTSLVRVKFHCFASMADHLVRKKSGKGEIDFSCFLGKVFLLFLKKKGKVDCNFSGFPIFQEILTYFSQKSGKVEIKKSTFPEIPENKISTLLFFQEKWKSTFPVF